MRPVVLSESLLQGTLRAREFVAMGPDELANPKLRAANKALDAALMAELVLSNTGGCEIGDVPVPEMRLPENTVRKLSSMQQH